MSASRMDAPRPQDPLAYERGFWGQGLSSVAGVDEVGRGPLAGPVVVAAVVLPEGCCIEGVADSKTLSPRRHEALASEILRCAIAVRVRAASVREIDRMNILRATTLAMNRALRALPVPPSHIVVDGLPVRGLSWPHNAIVGGDGRVHSIACASIVAKVTRDLLMRRLAVRYPAYGWDRNKGYGTADHLRALRDVGPSPHHRVTFGRRQLTLRFDGRG